MGKRKEETFSVNIMLNEMIVDHSEVLASPAPILSVEGQAFVDAVRRYQNAHRRARLTWRNIFQNMPALGYCKVEHLPKPPESQESPQGPARLGAAGNETPS